MENKPAVTVFAAILFIAAAGLVAFWINPGLTGSVTTYRQLPLFGGAQDLPDPHVQYFPIDEGVCKLVRERYTTFLTRVERRCDELNPGRPKNQGLCRYQAELDADILCRPAPIFENIRPPQYITGEVAVDPLSCASLAENYDLILQQTLERADAPRQTIAMINPCSDRTEAATRQQLDVAAPLRQYARAVFPDGDVLGSTSDEANEQGEVRYVRCANGVARVIVSGVSVCNTLG